jgi:hypothetical protein
MEDTKMFEDFYGFGGSDSDKPQRNGLRRLRGSNRPSVDGGEPMKRSGRKRRNNRRHRPEPPPK